MIDRNIWNSKNGDFGSNDFDNDDDGDIGNEVGNGNDGRDTTDNGGKDEKSCDNSYTSGGCVWWQCWWW